MPTVYLADRDPSFRKSLAHSLRQGGADVLTFESGFDLYAQAIEQEPDLIVMDNDLKEMNGFEVFGRLRRRRGRLPPVVFVAHFNNRGLVDRILDRGALDFLQKSRPQEEILAAVKRHLRELPERPIATTSIQSVVQPVAQAVAIAEANDQLEGRGEPVETAGAAVRLDASAIWANVEAPADETAAAPEPAWRVEGWGRIASRVGEAAGRMRRSRDRSVAGAAGLVRRTRERGMAASALVGRTRERGTAATSAVVRRARDITAVTAAEWRRDAATGVRLARAAGELLALVLACLAAEIREACAGIVAGSSARLRRTGSLLTAAAGRARWRTAAALVLLAEEARKTSAAFVRRAREVFSQADTVYVASAPAALTDGVASFRRMELDVREHVPAWRTTLARHRKPLLNGAGSLAIAAGIFMLLLTDRPREPEVVMLSDLNGGWGAAGPRTVESRPTPLWTEEDLEREPALDPATALAEDPENAEGDLERSGEAPRTAARRMSRPKVYATPDAEPLTIVRALSQEPAPVPVPRASRRPRSEKRPADRGDHVAAVLPFGPLGQRNEPAWSNSFRVAGTASVQLGMIDEDRDGVPEAPPVKAGRPAAAD